MQNTINSNKNEVVWDGRTVWVNSGIDGSCIGRFSQFGVDVHMTGSEQMETGRQCLACSADGSIDGWDEFVEMMRKHHRVKISKEARPKYLDEQLPDRHCISCGKSWNRKRQGVGVVCPSCHSRNVTDQKSL